MSVQVSSANLAGTLSSRIFSPSSGSTQQLQGRQMVNGKILPYLKKGLKIIKKEHVTQQINQFPLKKQGMYSELEEENEKYSLAQISTKIDDKTQEKVLDNVQMREKKSGFFNTTKSAHNTSLNLSNLSNSSKQKKKQTINKSEREEQTCPNQSISKEKSLMKEFWSKLNKSIQNERQIPPNNQKNLKENNDDKNDIFLLNSNKIDQDIIEFQTSRMTSQIQKQQSQSQQTQLQLPVSSVQPWKVVNQARTIGHILNLVFGIISILKVTLNTFILFQSHQETQNSLYHWVLFMLAYDVSYIFYLVLSSISMNRCSEDELIYFPVANEDDQPSSTNLHSLVIESFISKLQPINFIKVQSNAEKKFPSIMYWGEFCRLSYILIFIFGNILFISHISSNEETNSNEQMLQESTNLFQLGLLFLVFGYIYLSIPLIACLIWPAITMIQYCIESCFQKPILPTVDPSNLLKLKICNFSEMQLTAQSSSNLQECIICQLEYHQNDKVVTLPCNQKHFFHENCCKQWLKVKGNCPVCRISIDKAFGKK